MSSGSAPVPTPSAPELARSDALRAEIVAHIAEAGGSIAFEDYMHMALNAPDLGYYADGLRGFGAGGDFVTAPELSPVFAHAIANAIAPVLGTLGPKAQVLEIGAGSGALAEGLIDALIGLGSPPSAYLILEPSPRLRAAQRERLMPLTERGGCAIEWLDTLDEVALHGVLLANEVADVLPVQRFVRAEETFLPLDVGWRESALCEVPGSPDAELAAWGEALESRLGRELGSGYRSERCRWLSPWLKSLAETLVKGLALIIDYGYAESEYYHHERSDGTLMCYYRHRAHPDPFFLPGLQDLTASVDFSAMAAAARGHGFELAGYTSQAWFLIENGLATYMESFAGDAREYAALAGAVRTLTLPGEMGERVKCMALVKGDTGAALQPVAGFSQRDLRARL